LTIVRAIGKFRRIHEKGIIVQKRGGIFHDDMEFAGNGKPSADLQREQLQKA
jgi:hypothetical protein